MKRKWTMAPGQLFDFYISTTGNDANPGTVAQPWAITSLQDTNSNNSKMSGKRVGLLPGTYNIGSMTSGSNPSDFQHPVLRPPPGSIAASTVLGSSDSVGNYSPRTATILYPGTNVFNPALGCNGNDTGGYVVIDGLIVDGTGLTYNTSPPQGLISFNSNTGTDSAAGTVLGCGVKNCEIRHFPATPSGDNQAGVFSAGFSGFFLTNCVIHDIHKAAQPDHAHGYLEYSNQGSQITYNTIYDCDTAVHAKSGASGTVVAYNYFYNCPTIAIQGMDGAIGNPNTPGTEYSIHHNVIDFCAGSGADPAIAGDINGGSRKQGSSWYNNTYYTTYSGAQTIYDLRATVAAVNLYNNIIRLTANNGSSDSNVGICVGLNTGDYTTVDFNCYSLNSYTQGWGLAGSTYGSLSAWQTASSADAHSITSNPTFNSAVTSGNGPTQFQLAGGSPCIGTGSGGTTMGAWDGTVTKIGADWWSYPGP